MPVLVDGAFVVEWNHVGAVAPFCSGDVETFLLIFHDAISDQAPLLRRLVFEWHYVNLIAVIWGTRIHITPLRFLAAYVSASLATCRKAEGLWLWKLSCLIVVITKYCTGLECSVATNMYLNMVFKYFEQILFRIFIIKIKFNSKFRFKKIVNSVVKPCNTAWATGWRWASVICSR